MYAPGPTPLIKKLMIELSMGQVDGSSNKNSAISALVTNTDPNVALGKV